MYVQDCCCNGEGQGMGAFVSLFVYEGGFETIKGWEKLPASWVLFKTEH